MFSASVIARIELPSIEIRVCLGGVKALEVVLSLDHIRYKMPFRYLNKDVG